MDIDQKLQQAQRRYEELTVALSDPAVFDNQKKYAELSREHAELSRITDAYHRFQKVRRDFESNKELIEMDPELADMAKAENAELEQELENLDKELKLLLVPKDPEDSRNAIVEIRAGTGGDEAAIFAGDLFSMYRRYADKNGWSIDLMEMNESSKGGYKEIVFGLSGNEVFGKMKYESGVHRVQRVPETESQGRVHTSAATVAVLPEAEEVDIVINPADLEFEAYRSTGAGGQHVNTTDSAVRIKHVPSGVVVTCQEERSQLKNREKAMVLLRTKLYETEYEKKRKEREQSRRNQVSTGDRSAKIRTYNFPQGRLTDHRIGLTLYNLDDIMKGDIGSVIDSLQVHDHLDRLNSEQ
jgi:peptide chain release factor 1